MPRILNVGYMNISNCIEVPLEGPPRGIEGMLLITIMEALGMNYRLITPPDPQLAMGRVNGSWRNLIGLVHRGEADIALSSVAIFYNRLEAVDFTIPYLYSNLNFATNLPQVVSRVYAYLYPFDRTTWALVVTVVLASPLVFCALLKTRDYTKEWLNILGHLLGQSITQRISGPSQVIFMIGWWFGTVILCMSYASMIFACLYVPLFDVPPNDFGQLSRAVKRGDYKVFVSRTRAVKEILESSENEDIRYIGEVMKRNDWYIKATKPDDKLFAHQSAVISSSFHMRLMFGVKPFATKHQSEGVYTNYCAILVNKRLTHYILYQT